MSTSLKQDLLSVRKAKAAAVAIGKRKTEADKVFKDRQRRALERMQREDVESLKTAGTLFSPVEKQYASIEDRSAFVRWAIENSEPVAHFLFKWAHDVDAEILGELIQALEETTFIRLKEHSDPLNALVREHLDDGQPLPPGVSFRTDTYISQRNG